MANKRIEPGVLEHAAGYVRELMKRGGAKQVVAGKRWGISQSTVSNVVTGEAIGIDVAIRIVKAEGGSLDAMFGLAADDGSKRLRDADGWARARERASQIVSPDAVDEVGAFVPQRPVDKVDAGAVIALVEAWLRVCPMPHATHEPEAGPTPAKPVAPFGVAGARASKKRDRQAT